ncbi:MULTISPECIES: hypothetical protein [unclassified Corynebacterium]|uniref:hypothetical protein n=1 Tax=unclassified Corynebacterium TaxID=2624378 RepID=UPI002A91C9AA|nr:hypothetical protein [Corynebacterium sp.]MDY5785766.1 hypothetical protein [Corynebacterium sp.]
MTNRNTPNDPNFRDDANRRVDDLTAGDVNDAARADVNRTDKVAATQPAGRPTEGSTAVRTEDNEGGGWWKWLLGLLALLLLGWLLWGLFSGNNEGATTTSSTTEVVATETDVVATETESPVVETETAVVETEEVTQAPATS